MGIGRFVRTRATVRTCAAMTSVLLAAAPILAAEHGAEAAPEAKGGLPPFLNFDLPLAFWTLVVFGLLLLVLKRFAWGPILKALDAREQTIRKDLEDAEQTRAKAQQLLEEHDRKLAAVQDEVRAILDEARRDAQHTSQSILRESQQEAQAIRERARREIEQARDHALKEIWDQAARLATMAAGRIIAKELSPADHERIVEQALAEFSSQRRD